jgi:hypothetical protein
VPDVSNRDSPSGAAAHTDRSVPAAAAMSEDNAGRVERWTHSLSKVQVLLLTLTAVVVAAGGLWAAIAGFGHTTPSAVPGGASGPEQGALPAHNSDTASSSIDTDSDGPAPRRQGALDLTQGYYADLDSESGDWGVDEWPAVEQDIYLSSGMENLTLDAPFQSDLAVLNGRPARYGTCANASAYVSSVGFEQLKPGTILCIRTSGGRIALALVSSTDKNPPGIPAIVHFEIAVWDRR